MRKQTRNLTNLKFGRLTALESVRVHTGGNWRYAWRCQCDCGNLTLARSDKLIDGKTRSCGCLLKEYRRQPFGDIDRKGINLVHGHSTTSKGLSPTYISWQHAKDRCFNPNATGYHWYGGRGITMCDLWKNSFKQFLNDMGERLEGTTLDRIDTNGNYEPGNCRWADRRTQSINSRPRKKKTSV